MPYQVRVPPLKQAAVAASAEFRIAMGASTHRPPHTRVARVNTGKSFAVVMPATASVPIPTR